MTTTAPAPRAARTARPKRPRPSIAVIAGIVVAVGVTVWAGLGIEFTLLPLFTDIARGAPILEGFLAPNWGFVFRVWDSWVETLSIAVLASLVGCGIALVLSFFASTVTARNPIVFRLARFVLSLIRSLPDIAYGLIFVAAVGVGSLAGTLALIMFNIGVCAKLTSETIDGIDPGPIEAADASGAGVVQRARAAVLPQILPNYLSYSFYVFELNIRASVVIGLVGGGGIGDVIRVQTGRFAYENLSAIVIALFVIVFALDVASRAIRRRLI